MLIKPQIEKDRNSERNITQNSICIHASVCSGEKPYSCEICGRRFTQKQNMTSHLTTHRKPKSEKSFRAHFGELEQYDAMSAVDFKDTNKNLRAIEQAKELASIGGGHYMLGDVQNIEVHTATDGEVDQQNVGLEHGLGLLSSVARKGDTADVQVDGIVNLPESQYVPNSNNMEQVVEVLIRNNDEKANNSLVQNPNQSKIILDPNTQAITDADGQEIPLDTNTAANLANILQNPDVLAAINNAASSNKFIVIGPVSMFDGSTAQSNSVMTLTSSDNSVETAISSISDEQLAQLSVVAQPVSSSVTQVSSQTVNDSISASSALAAVESFLHNEQPSSSGSKVVDPVVSNILGSIQPDGKRGPSAVVQSAHNKMPITRASNLTISMPRMTHNPLSITPAKLAMRSDKLPIMKSLTIQSAQKNSSSEVSSSVDQVTSNINDTKEKEQQQQHNTNQQQQEEPEPSSDTLSDEQQIHEAEQSHQMIVEQEINIQQEEVEAEQHLQQQQVEAESTTQQADFIIEASSAPLQQQFIASAGNDDGVTGVADSSDMIDETNEASSSGEPVLLLSTDENGRPQIIVKMPDGTETIMSDPALAESLIQVPTITNADMEISNSEAEPSQSMVVDQLGGTIQLQIPDQGVPEEVELPTQSGVQPQYVSQSDQPTGSNVDDVQQLPDQTSVVNQEPDQTSVVEHQNVHSSGSMDLMQSSVNSQQNLITNSVEQSMVQTPDSSSQSYSETVTESHIDSRQGLFVMEHVSASDEAEQSNFAEQSNIDFTEEETSEFTVDSSSNFNAAITTKPDNDVSQENFLQLNDVSQSTNIECEPAITTNSFHATPESTSTNNINLTATDVSTVSSTDNSAH